MGKSKRKQLAKKQLSKSKKKSSDPFIKAKNPYASAGVGGNRFDIKDNLKAKHSVLGRKVKGRSRDVARARTMRREEQESMLRPAIQNADKVNTFIDKRLGEGDETLDQEERDLQRFIKVQKDRFRTTGKGGGKSNKFNLEGDDEGSSSSGGGLTLTHGGRAINDLDFSGHQGMDDDEDDELGGRVVERLHFGGGDSDGHGNQGDAIKSRDEIYKELIAKSKMYKAQRQQQKRVDEEEQDKLDDEMDELRRMLDFRPKKTSKEQEFDAMMARAGLSKDGNNVDVASDNGSGTIGASDDTKKGLTHKERRQGLGSMGAVEDHDEFDIMARSLLFEARAQASDRTKTPEERAKDELEEMKEKEEERKKRARGDYVHDDEKDMNDVTKGTTSTAKDGGDSLGQNFAIDEAFVHKDVLSGGDNVRQDDEEEDDALTTKVDDSEMPFVIPCPRTISEFKNMIQRWTNDEDDSVEILIGRIMKNHSVHLPWNGKGINNREKMSNLYTLLMKYIIDDIDYNVVPLSRISYILASVFELGKDIPIKAGECYRTNVTKIHTECFLGVNGEGEYVGKRWCTVGELMLLKSIRFIFPTTDYRHPVVTPALITIGGILSGQIPLHDIHDVTMAMYLCEVQLDLLQTSSKLAVEAINMTTALLASFVNVVIHVDEKRNVSNINSKRVNISRIVACTTAALKRVPCVDTAGSSMWLQAVFERTDDDDDDDDDDGDADADEDEEQQLIVPSSNKQRLPSQIFRCHKINRTTSRSLLISLLGLNERIVMQYGRNISLAELLGPMIPMLSVFSIKKKKRRTLTNLNNMPATLGLNLENIFTILKDDISDRLKIFLSTREPLRLQKLQKVAVPIRSQRPMFDENYIVKKDNDPDKERAELKSLKRKLKREEKAMARDVRKDSLFIAQEQEKTRVEWEADVKKKYNNFVEFVNQQHAAAKNVQREGVGHGGGMKSGRKFKRARHASPYDSKNAAGDKKD